MSGRKNVEIKNIALRIPMELARKLELVAEREKRSVNNQIVYLVEKALAGESAPIAAAVAATETAPKVEASPKKQKSTVMNTEEILRDPSLFIGRR